MSESKFLASGILCNSSSSSESCENDILAVLHHLNVPVVHLPLNYHKYFQLEAYTITENLFLSLFFQNLDMLSSIQQSRDQLILRMLEVYAAEYDDDTERSYTFQAYFQTYMCIPSAPDGSVLKKPSELIDPNSPFAKLYDVEENRFPTKELTERYLACTSLIELGMIYKRLPYKEVVERAQTIESLYKQDKCKALNRVKVILKTVEFHMNNAEGEEEVALDSVPFLPVLPKTVDYPLSWAGDNCELLNGKSLMLHTVSRKSSSDNNGIIAGTQVVFVNEDFKEGCGKISEELQCILKVRSSPTCREVVRQLKELIDTFSTQVVTEDLKKWVERMCRQVYKFLDEIKCDEDIKTVQELTKIPCVWTGKTFLPVAQIAEQWKLDGPYLHKIPSVLSLRRNLRKILSVKEDFSIPDIENALIQMKNDFNDNPVDDGARSILKELVSYFF